jgi:hypothetical protein
LSAVENREPAAFPEGIRSAAGSGRRSRKEMARGWKGTMLFPGGGTDTSREANQSDQPDNPVQIDPGHEKKKRIDLIFFPFLEVGNFLQGLDALGTKKIFFAENLAELRHGILLGL